MSVLHGNSAQRLVLPKLNIKVEKVDTEYNSALQPGFGLPPSPPSSSEDSEGGQSPNPSSMSAHDTRVQQLTSAVITNLSNLPASGPLYLSAEEKRTLVQEGYPVPTRLPLNKGEERSLKKIRRKIKNKISAQESRRKKKEYVDNLESKCETFSSENLELRKKVESLEHNNQSLLSQLQKLQVMVGRMTHSSKHVTTQTTGTCLMVLVLCFAVFFGSYSPSGVGFHHISALQSRSQVPMGADFNPDSADSGGGYGLNVYSTSSKRSRVLLSFHEENTEMACLADAFPSGRSKSDDVLQAQDTTATNNETGSSKGQSDEGSPSSGAPVKKSRDQLSGSLALSAEMRSKLNEVSVTIGASDLSTQVPTKVIAVDRVRNTTE
ncbi:PREDICTED: cyclic AMP-responsive element-binding protein 3-like protein 2 [Priapulus caudatus]|uniref:Cyclic AMP-responsive element-binding protein 3-like protein 2 n=1 Tax=Priapulus caudatus TaxID=37621 RepID=A0ABM1EGK6_PRICU|nr:PREDICTED: cyclic AMP-responsive element-binding protein 3-like protein 2 [Priapulus caudatus]